jgi:putative holliday junction resolvase
MMRILGLDVGDKTIGVAVSDEMGWSAQPLTVIRRQAKVKDCRVVAGLVEDYQAQTVVVGLPRNMDGTLGPQAEKTQVFAQALEEEIQAEIVFVDERLSTKAAERTLIEADMSRAKRKKVVDKIAASIILQGYLDQLSFQKGGR